MKRPRPASPIAAWSLLLLAGGTPISAAVQPDQRSDILGKPPGSAGVWVVLGDPRCELARELAEGSRWTVYVQVRKAEDREAACRAADAAGLFGTRIFVGSGAATNIHLADNLADGLVAADGPAEVAKAEALRVLRPGGKAWLGQEVLTKPLPDGADDWSHHYHGPDNNPQSSDRLAAAPYLTQFIAEPRYAPAPQNVVVSGGRIFLAFGHVAWKQRAEPWLNTLAAVNSFNGAMLWKRGLPPGVMVDRSTMIATPTTLYLADHQSCKRIDPATGEVADEIAVPADLAGGTFWKWMALADGVLYALVGEAEPPDPVRRWRSTEGGWSWEKISDGYNAKDPPSPDPRGWKRSASFQPSDYRWGFSKTLLAIDPRTKHILWRRQEQDPIDSRSLCMKNGRLFLGHFGKHLACLDAKTGRAIWRRTAEADPELFRAIGPYCPYQIAWTGWRSTIYARCSDHALYLTGPQVFDLTAISAEDGRYLWTYRSRMNHHVLIREDGLYIVGPDTHENDTHKLDPLTGEVLASHQLGRRTCTRVTGSADGILFRGGGGDGTILFDPARGASQWISPMRPSCFIGALAAQGHIYWTPWDCDCSLQLFGLIGCGPAGGFQFDQAADASERLETTSGGALLAAPFAHSPDDWPTYRANPARTAVTRVAIPSTLRLLWTFTPDTPSETAAPTAAGGLVFLSGADGIVRALDAASGALRWRVYTGGAVRCPPTIAGGRALVGSGDGYVYAFEVATGRLLWRFRAAPAERRIPVYNSLMSTWPVASGVLIDQGVAYCAAGINNYDGTHVYALDAASGKMKWQNNRSGAMGPYSGAGAGVQGDLLLDSGKLYLAGGNAASPAVFDIANGTCLDTGQNLRPGRELRLILRANRRGETERRVEAVGQPLYSTPESPVYVRPSQMPSGLEWDPPIVRARNARLLCRRSHDGWELTAQAPMGAGVLWRQPLPGEPVRWGVAVDARGRIVVTIRNGTTLCFGQ